MHSSWSVWDFRAVRPRGIARGIRPGTLLFSMRPVRASEGDRPLVPTLTASSGTPSAPGRDRRLHRPAPVGPRGPGGGPQAPRHVYRVDRRPRAAALPGGDPRQRRGRGAGRLLHRDRGHAARGRLGRGQGQRPRHPGRRRAQDQAQRRGAGDDQAARGREVRRRLVHRLRRPARRRRLGRQRAGLAAGRRGGPGGAHLGGELPPRRHRRVRRAGAGRELQPGSRGCASSAASPGGPPGPGSGSGRTGRCSSRTPGSASTRSPSGPGRPPTWCPA